jgi:hypothetical protein
MLQTSCYAITPSSRPDSTRSALRRLNQLGVLLRVRLLDIPLCHLLHHEVAVNLDILDQQAIGDAPLAGNGQHADGRLGVDEAVDARGRVGECELVGCLCGGLVGLG